MTNYESDGPYVRHGTTCKFCKNPITIEVAVSYAALGDPHGIIPMAACDRCADLHEERRILEDRVRIAAMTLNNIKGVESRKEANVRYTGIFEKLLHDYAKMIARWHYLQGESWDQEAVAMIIEHPEAWPSVLRTFWAVFRDANAKRAKAL